MKIELGVVIPKFFYIISCYQTYVVKLSKMSPIKIINLKP